MSKDSAKPSGATISGDALAELLAATGDEGTGHRSTSSNTMASQLETARGTERKHEIVALVGDHLIVNYENYHRFRTCSDAASATMVVSFIGDTAVGKSTSIRELMKSGEERPYVQRSAEQSASTTFNVNLYPCRSLFKGMTVNFLDFEGESGSSLPAMGQKSAIIKPSKSAAGVTTSTPGGILHSMSLTEALLPTSYEALTAAVLNRTIGSEESILDRAKNVREHFPRLAYCCSDVIVLIGTDKLFGSRYLERALAFAKQANSNIQDVELPVLLIISNKIDVDECEMNIERTTRAFQEHMGRDLAQLDAYFSCIVVCQLPNKKTTAVTEDGRMLIGTEMYAEQITKIRTLLASLLNSRLAERDNRLAGSSGPGRRIITARQGLWYSMMPRIVDKLNGDEAVHVARLVDEAWAESIAALVGQEAPMDIFKTFITYARPAPSLSKAAVRMHEDYIMRFTMFFELISEICVRLVAARLRALDRSLLFEDRVEAAARPQLEMALQMLNDIMPCRSVYGEGHKGSGIELGIPVDRPDEPVLCLQERRVHTKSHRGARRVKGGGPSIWQRLLSVVPYNPTWAGEFCPAVVRRTDLRSMMDDVYALLDASEDEFCHQLLDLQLASCPSLQIDYAPIQAQTPTSAGEFMDQGPILIRSAQLDCTMMPYCVGCARRAHQGPIATHSYEEADETKAAESHSVASLDDEKREPAWSLGLFSEFFTLASAEAKHILGIGRATPIKTVSFAKSEEPASDGTASSQSKRGGLRKLAAENDAVLTAAAQQHVTFGLCSHCVTTVLDFNARTRADASDSPHSPRQTEQPTPTEG